MRFVGEAVACVVAETALQAKDAAEAVELDIDELPAVTTPAAALAEGAPQIHDDAPGNLVLDFHYGNAEAVAKASAEAAHVTRLEIRSNRVVVNAMEPRSAIGSWDAVNERWVLNVGCQGVFGLRGGLAGVLNVKPDRLHVLTGNVGGSFGMKAPPYPEYAPLLLAARKLGRPVKWTDERSESFLSDHHGRDHQRIAELALDKDGHFLAVRLSGTGNAGAYIYPPMPATTNAVKNVIDVYKTPAMEVNSKVAFTNTTPIAAYRGAGRPEGNYYMERLIDTAAREMGIDRVELRRRNHIAPEAMPYKAPSGMAYDSGEFTAVLDKALQASDWDGFRKARKAESKARGKLRGRGIGSYLEVTAPAGKEYGGIRFEERRHRHHAERHARLRSGPCLALRSGADREARHPFDRFRLLQGDSDQLLAGGGTGWVAVGDCRERGVSRSRRQGDRAGQGDCRPCAGSRDRRYRVRSWSVPDCWHRPQHRLARSRVEAARWHDPARGRASVTRRASHFRYAAFGFPERLSHCRSRDRSRYRPDRRRALLHGQRLRHAHQSDAGRRPGAWRCRAGHRTGDLRTHGL